MLWVQVSKGEHHYRLGETFMGSIVYTRSARMWHCSTPKRHLGFKGKMLDAMTVVEKQVQKENDNGITQQKIIITGK